MSASHRPFPPLILVGTDHRSAPLALREKVAYDAAGAEELLVHLLAREEVGEATVLSTCNRTEIYAVPRDGGDGDHLYRTVLDQTFLARAPEIEREGRLYVLRDDEAARHLLAVAAGLESMVLGEPEILGQVKQAAELAAAVGAAGPVVENLLRSAAEAGRRSRHETEIGTGAVSLGYAVVELATNVFRDLGGVRVLVVGAGETARQVMRNLAERGAVDFTVANRSRERAEALAADFQALTMVPLGERFEAAREADLIVTATSAPEPLFRRRDLVHAQERRSSRPLLVVDLGVPRNVDPAAGELDNLFLHSIDSLEGLIERNLRRRREEVPKVEEVVADELGRFAGWYRGRAAEPLVARLQKQAEAIRRREMASARKRFPAETHDELDRFTRSLVRKLLHNPSAGLRSGGADLRRLDLVAELFRLDDEEDDGAADPQAPARESEPADEASEKGSPA